jgi:hypothetical protein
LKSEAISVVLRTAHQTNSGNITSEPTWKITIPKIDPGSEHAFTFYAMNGSGKFVSLSFPATATGQFAGKSTPESVELVKAGLGLERNALAPVK